ncbi:peptidoglycan DD-metalloendopeptidase family protein [Rhodococcus opacus]|uniref:Peptidoglycan DD-metalloendopeptidase family protein n=1 Tax=Rhodococcus opacus TaxID=37919 RepID=A0AAX3YSN1_RHOOP|nr:peptidoglycan DD-metalloendopeptidase family protein [Rhodococcus opacus]WLF51510.1 peptidoglycan DD-metalloendopeptidase family protein [Rhodococcus opacus]
MDIKKLVAAAVAAVLGLVLLVVVVASDSGNECPAPATPGGSTAPSGSLVKPTKSGTTTLTSGFGPRWGTEHRGIDFAGDVGTPIYAFTDGRVIAAGPASGFGNWIIVDHQIDGKVYSTVYGHMFDDGVLVKAGDRVSAGQEIGRIGNAGDTTGAHLHFEVWDGGRLPDGVGTAVDPAPWVDQAIEPGQAPAPETGEGDGGAPTSPGTSTAPGLAVYNARQLAIAKQAVAIGEAMGVSERGITIALATIGRESTFRMLASSVVPESLNYPHDGVGSDNKSVNQYQQQVGIWGTVDELMNPVTANVKFYQALLQVSGWESMPVTLAAQTVQASAHPEAYAPWEDAAHAMYSEFKGASKELTTDELSQISSAGRATAVAAGGILPDACPPAGGEHGPLAPGPFGQKVIESASRWLGTEYAWGGGDVNGPTRGISDGGGAADAHGDTNKIGFDCSGLTLYAVYQASGGAISLPHFTGDHSNPGQLYDARGQDIPFDQKQPGDLIYFGSGGSTHHVGIYHGVTDGQDMLLNAPQSGDVVSIQPLSNWAGEEMYVRRFGDQPTERQPQ